MRSKRNRKPKPLFYINQPNIKTPIADMQDSFLFKNDELDDLNLEKNQDDILTIVETQEETAADEKEGKDGINTLQENKKKSFNDLTLDEKIKHLNLVPASVAKVRYEFITVDRSYKGYFLSNKSGALVILAANSRKKTISIIEEDLIDIKRIGL